MNYKLQITLGKLQFTAIIGNWIASIDCKFHEVVEIWFKSILFLLHIHILNRVQQVKFYNSIITWAENIFWIHLIYYKQHIKIEIMSLKYQKITRSI